MRLFILDLHKYNRRKLFEVFPQMKNQEDLFPADKCYIFEQRKNGYCARYEKVRIPSPEELLAMWMDKNL